MFEGQAPLQYRPRKYVPRSSNARIASRRIINEHRTVFVIDDGLPLVEVEEINRHQLEASAGPVRSLP
jgi:hypothetical protein